MNIPSPSKWAKSDFLRILDENLSTFEKKAYFNNQTPSTSVLQVKYHGINHGSRKLLSGWGFYISIALPATDEQGQSYNKYTLNLCIVRIYEEEDGLGWSVSLDNPLRDTHVDELQNFDGVFLE